VRDALCRSFEERYERPPRWIARAPGRVNLIGEHTDYQDGLVLPCAIDRATWVAAAPRSDDRVRVASSGWPEPAEFSARDAARSAPEPRWVDYVRGPFAVLARAGTPVPGIDLAIASQVPPESGLSSSAALQVGIALILDATAELGLGAREIALLAHRAEREFVGVACGIMDSFASALGQDGCALRIDCRTRVAEPIPIAGRVSLLVAQSGVPRQLAAGGYAERVAECEAALEGARAADVRPGARALRDFVPADLPRLQRALDSTLYRRARHVVEENARVEECCAALTRGDLDRVGMLLRRGMESLRSDFEVSIEELDFLCAAADEIPGCYGSRLTGAGWGGCTVHLVEPDSAARVAAVLADAFAARFSRRPPVLEVRPASGASLERIG
jgi:galactokinase